MNLRIYIRMCCPWSLHPVARKRKKNPDWTGSAAWQPRRARQGHDPDVYFIEKAWPTEVQQNDNCEWNDIVGYGEGTDIHHVFECKTANVFICVYHGCSNHQMKADCRLVYRRCSEELMERAPHLSQTHPRPLPCEDRFITEGKRYILKIYIFA